MFVRDIMNENSVFCTEETPLTKVYEMMLEKDCDYIPVVESRAHCVPIGVITEHDICFQILSRGRNPRDMSAANAMNTNIVKIIDTSDLNECLDAMESKQAKRVLIINKEGRLCGTLLRDEVEKNQAKNAPNPLFGSNEFSYYRQPGINRIF